MRPATMSGMSTRLIGLPAIFQSFGSLSVTSFGGASFAASPATLPKLVLRPLGPCVITPLDAVHSATGAFQPCAAAIDRKSTRLNSSHGYISYAVFCLKKKKMVVEG